MPAVTIQNQKSQNVALVTGAGNRIGAAIAVRLAAAGYAILVHYRDSAAGAKTIVKAIEALGGRAEAIAADLSDRSDRAGLIEAAGKPFGPLNVLVNNASVFEPDSALDVDEALWDRHFAVHLEAPVFLARDFAAALPAGTANANIVNIIDERVLHPTPAYFSYSLSKSALWTATRVMAQSFAPNIRVNAIGPGPVLPHAGQTQTAFDKSITELPLQQHADPAAIADGVMVLLTTPSMTGQMLALDGGRHLDFPDRRGLTPRK